jgi:hypothetical protein
MKVSELIEKLKEFNPDAKVRVVVYNREENFTFAWGYSEGCTKENCETLSLYVDRLSDKEHYNE